MAVIKSHRFNPAGDLVNRPKSGSSLLIASVSQKKLGGNIPDEEDGRFVPLQVFSEFTRFGCMRGAMGAHTKPGTSWDATLDGDPILNQDLFNLDDFGLARS
jgi:hypothetical protein